MGSMMPMPEEVPEEERHDQMQEERYEYPQEYRIWSQDYPSDAILAEYLRQPEAAIADSISRIADLVRAHLLGGPNSSYLIPRSAILQTLNMEFKEHSGDLKYSLGRALNDFDHYRQVNQVPLLLSDGGGAPVAMRTVQKGLESNGLLKSDEKLTDPNNLQKAIDNWMTLDETHTVGRVEEASDALHDNLETFLGSRYGGLRMWEKSEFAQRVPSRGAATDPDFDEPTSPNIDTGLFRVTVKCKAKGYRILVSPAYFIDWVYFGAPSTPVTSEMLPGRYIFGTDSIGRSVVSDGLVFRIPASFNPQLMRF